MIGNLETTNYQSTKLQMGFPFKPLLKTFLFEILIETHSPKNKFALSIYKICTGEVFMHYVISFIFAFYLLIAVSAQLRLGNAIRNGVL